MNKVIIMGMVFDANNAPDFRSIYAVKIRSGELLAVNEYGGLATDVELLPQITNAAAGSTYRCDDTGDIYVRQLSGSWIVFGGAAESDSQDQTASTTEYTPTLSPLIIDRNALTGSVDIGDGQTSETLEFEPETVEEIAAAECEEITLETPENTVMGETDGNEVR